MMHGPEKSDPVIVATKQANKTAKASAVPSVEAQAVAEPVERRAGTKGNADRQSTHWTQRQAMHGGISVVPASPSLSWP